MRPARQEDAASLLAIYAPVVEHTAISWELVPPSVEEFGQRISKTLTAGFPYWVAEADGVVVGYAYAGPFRDRPAYRFTCESTVYIAESCRGQGLGRMLYEKLFESLRDKGFVAVIAGVALPNEASLGLHKSMGFREVGTYSDIGYKFDKWWSSTFLQLDLSERYLITEGSNCNPLS